MKKQFGGTLLGFILGALVGLGAALAVTVYITKVPIPFVNKTQARSPGSDAAEAKKNRDWNPNAPLGGKAPSNPGTPAPEFSAPPLIIAPGPAISAPKTAKAPAVSSDPLGDLAKARTAPSPAAALPPGITSGGSGPDPFSYFIQVGAFRTPEDAEQQRARISLMGLQARVTEREQAGRTVYRVRLGPFDKKEDADRAKDRLDGNSFETALVRVQK